MADIAIAKDCAAANMQLARATTPERNTPIKPNSTTCPGPHHLWIFGHRNLSEGDWRQIGCVPVLCPVLNWSSKLSSVYHPWYI